MVRFIPLILIYSIIILLPQKSYSLAMDWHGFFGIDASLIDNYRKIEQTNDRSDHGTDADGINSSKGTQEVPLAPGNHANASFQSYVFHLNPTLIINDAASLKAEATTGYGRGGRLGDDSAHAKEPGMANALYTYNTSSGNEDIVINKLYMELYSDTATYLIGRHSSDWGLGALYDSGDDPWDRHTFVRDGVTMKIKIGNFFISPYWAKISSSDSLTRATNVKEYGASILYDNIDRDITFGLLYGKKQNAPSNTTESTSINQPANQTTTTNLGKSNVKITNLFLRKKFGDLSLALEVPILSGELGNIYSGQGQTKYKAKAFIFESSYILSTAWSFGLHAGQVSGDNGGTTSFDGMYLNPNYQIANLLFRYNMRAISSPSERNIFDSYVSNTTYLKFSTHYKAEKWAWDGAVIYAKAEEAAKSGSYAFNHQANRHFYAYESQSDDLGLEVDSDFHYYWNSEITITGSAGYLFTGDYFAYTNDHNTGNDPSNPKITNTATNSYILQLKVGMDF